MDGDDDSVADETGEGIPSPPTPQVTSTRTAGTAQAHTSTHRRDSH